MAALVVFMAHADQLAPEMQRAASPWHSSEKFRLDFARSCRVLALLLALLERNRIMPDLEDALIKVEDGFEALVDALNQLNVSGKDKESRRIKFQPTSKRRPDVKKFAGELKALLSDVVDAQNAERYIDLANHTEEILYEG